MTHQTVWQTKLHARLHDPAEKALVLLRDREGHEGGTSRALHRDLGFESLPVKEWLDPDDAQVLGNVLFEKGIPTTMYRHVRRADWWAAGADRPQWPMQEITVTTETGQRRTLQVADWARVRWTNDPVLIHPLTGRAFDLGSLADTDISDIKERSFAHFSRLIVRDGSAVDWRRTLFAYWRFGPELAEEEDNGKLGMLWSLLPADTRVPDHSIWDHLDLTSAFAGAFAADPKGEAALLAVSLGPVQGFIAAARSTSDLWAGSHLLSRLSWEAMKPVCERLGPDAILFPRLRGVPQVDLWLREIGLCAEWFKGAEWRQRTTDANPLFAAALPNRFVAVLPASQVEDIAAAAAEAARAWLQRLGAGVVDRLLQTAGLASGPIVYAREQMQRQLEGFPEVHWAAVPFSLIRPRDANTQTDLDLAMLSDAMAPFFGVEKGEACGFLDSPAWRVLQQEIRWSDNTTFFAPKPGVLYPAVYDLAERALAAAKSTHTFSQLEQTGWRDSLTGENEWLSLSQQELNETPGRRVETLWARVARNKPAWAKAGEHLGALSAIKRLWPTIFAEKVGKALGEDTLSRFVVSTHTMALAHQLDQWLERGSPLTEELRRELETTEPVALPRRLMRHQGHHAFSLAKRLPNLLDQAADDPDETRARRVQNIIRHALAVGAAAEETPRLETYYALLMMDGDEMGAWLSGGKDCASYRDCFHPMVRSGFDARAAGNRLVEQYGRQPRAVSPNRHLAISAALNDFALLAVPEVVEREHGGRVIYAGGDDVLAMLPVADLVSAMRRLRRVYSGHDPASGNVDWRRAMQNPELTVRDGFGLLRGRLLRLMGDKATASCGAVIAHHQAPLSAVLGELRAAEQRAKLEGGRDAWSLALVKRSAGAIHLTAKWGEPLDVLEAVRGFLVDPDVSRRAVYHTLDWIESLPPNDPSLFETLLAYQLERQAESDSARSQAPALARWLVKIAFDRDLRPKDTGAVAWMKDLLIGAEFLAREVRR
jgi:CRISPR-associated protein Cmr2